MTWRMIGQPIEDADLVAPIGVSQKFRHPTSKMIIAGAVVGLVICDDPTFTSVRLKLYTDRNGTPGKLLATSTNSWTKAQVHTLPTAKKDVGFSFTPITLQGNVWYHLVVDLVGYTYSAASHVAWRFDYPDPKYQLNLTLDAASAIQHPLDFTLFGKLLGASE